MKGIARLAIKILSLYFLIEFISEGIPQIIGIINSRGSLDNEMIIVFLFVHVLKFIFIIFLWFFAEWLSDKFFCDQDEKINITVSQKQIYLLIFSTVGLILLVISLPNLIQYIFEYFSKTHIVSNIFFGKVGAEVIKSILGFWLLFKPITIVNKIKNND